MNKVCWELCGFKVTLKGLKQQQFYALPCLILQSFFFFFYLTFLFISSDIVPVVKHLSRFTVWDSLAFREPSLLVAGHEKGRARTGISSCIWMPRQRRFWPETRCLAVPFLWTRYLRNARRDFGTSSHFVLIPGLINCIHLSPHLFFFFHAPQSLPTRTYEEKQCEERGNKGRSAKWKFIHLKCHMKHRAFVLMAPADCSWISCQFALIRYSEQVSAWVLNKHLRLKNKLHSVFILRPALRHMNRFYRHSVFIWFIHCLHLYSLISWLWIHFLMTHYSASCWQRLGL